MKSFLNSDIFAGRVVRPARHFFSSSIALSLLAAILWGCGKKNDLDHAADLENKPSQQSSESAPEGEEDISASSATESVHIDEQKTASSSEDLRTQILELAQEDPAAAFEALKMHLLRVNASDEILRELLTLWWEKDSQNFTDFLSQQNDGYLKEKVLNSLFQEHFSDDSASQWFAWIDSLESNGTEDLSTKKNALSAMLNLYAKGSEPQFSAESFTLLSQSIEQKIDVHDFRHLMPEYGYLFAVYNPRQTPQLMERFPNGPTAQQVLERAVAELGRSNPQIGAQWLSSPEIFQDAFNMDYLAINNVEIDLNSLSEKDRARAEEAITNAQNRGYDKALKQYILAVAETNPKEALQSVDSITDPRKREYLRQQIQDLIDISP